MSSFIFIIGLIIGISAFMYLYLAAAEGKKKFGKFFTETEKVINKKELVEPENVGFRNIRSISPGERICPLCGSILTKYEGLYASKTIESSERKILIMGCKYCFKDE